MNLKEKFEEVKAIVKSVFDFPPAQPAMPTAPAPTAPAGTVQVYTLMDGTEISVAQAGATPAVGDLVTIAGAPAPEGNLTLADGSSLTVDASGAITALGVAAGPVTQDLTNIPRPAPTMEQRVAALEGLLAKTNAYTIPAAKEAMSAMTAKFAVGDVESRVANLEVMAKALMESEFGYQISANERIESQNQAIAVYQTTLDGQTSALAAAKLEIEKYSKVQTAMFELIEMIVEKPTAEPKTISPAEKQRFEKTAKSEARLNGMVEALKKVRSEK